MRPCTPFFKKPTSSLKKCSWEWVRNSLRYAEAAPPFLWSTAPTRSSPSEISKRSMTRRGFLSLKMDEEILHDLPQQYMVDEVNKALNPGGLYGRKLGVQSLMIFTNANRIRNIVRAVHQAGYEVPNVFFTSYAACEVALDGTERAQGRILIDIGAKATSVLLFQDNILRRLKKIEIGGDAFTRRIAEQLSLPLILLRRSNAPTPRRWRRIIPAMKRSSSSATAPTSPSRAKIFARLSSPRSGNYWRMSRTSCASSALLTSWKRAL